MLANARIDPMTHPPAMQPRNPLHGITLEKMLLALVDTYGWAELATRVPLRCFAHEPSIASSLTFLRRTPWARDKVENLYLFMLRDARRAAQRPPRAGNAKARP